MLLLLARGSGAVCWTDSHMPRPLQLLPSLPSVWNNTNIHIVLPNIISTHADLLIYSTQWEVDYLAYPEGSTTRMKLWPRDSENTCTINKHKTLAQQRCLASLSPEVVEYFC